MSLNRLGLSCFLLGLSIGALACKTYQGGGEEGGYGGEPIAFCAVRFINNTRGGDLVVSARDRALGLPGGIKVLDANVVTPPGGTATLNIRRQAGSTGSAVFQSNGTAARAVTGQQTITLNGREVSDQARNMVIDSTVGGVQCGSFEFTVFRVDPTARTSGDVDTVLPATALAFAGAGPRTLVTEYKRKTGNDDDLGHKHKADRAYGGIVFQGQIVPSRMNRNDFNLTHSRTEAFNWDRAVSGRDFASNGCLSDNLVPHQAAADVRSDDLSDNDEDLLPDSDGTAGELFIWVIDVANGLPAQVPNDGEITRKRKNFTETVQYAGVKSSQSVNWFWRSSQENPVGPGRFIENNDFANDNQLRAGSTTPLTANLGNSAVPNFTVTGSTPAASSRAVANLAATVRGTQLDSLRACPRFAYMIRENFDARRGLRTSISLRVNAIAANLLTGTYNIGAQAELGAYAVKVVIADKAMTSPNPLTVNP